MLELSRDTPLAVGHLRQVFQHPEKSDQVIKVMRADAVETRLGGKRNWYKRLPRAKQYVGYVRELKEYIASQAKKEAAHAPIARIVGLVETDLGLGQICEKVREPNGALARTLASMYVSDNGFSAAVEANLDTFYRALIECNVIVGDMHAWNIVYGFDSRGGPRFVLIDGFGEKSILPLSSMSRKFNARNTARLYRRMRNQVVELLPLEARPFDVV
jgi:hypothetical protein